MIGQAFALVVLKFRLMRAMGSASRVVSTLLLAAAFALGLLFSLGVSAIVFYFIASADIEIDELVLLLALDGVLGVFLFMWAFGLVMELQRSDALDFRKMMYLPVSLRMIYFLNFLVSLVSPTLILFAPPLIALVLGLAFRFGAPMLLGVPLVLTFFLMVGAWAYYVRGLLAIVMQNKRRRRLVLTLLPVMFVLLGQAPNLFLTLSRDRFEGQEVSDEEAKTMAVAANIYVPLGWMPYGIYALLEDDTRSDALACIAGLGTLTLAGLGMGYRSTRRFYAEGATDGSARPKAPTGKKGRIAATLRKVPALDQEASALTAAAFLSFARHPNIRMMIVMPIIMGGVLIVIFMQGDTFREMGDEVASVSWLPVAVLVWPFMNFSHVFFNQFGIDREAFRGMLLLPTPRHKILLAKNIALFPFVAPLGLAYTGAAALIFGTTPENFAMSMVIILQLYFSFCVLGNFTSLLLPYRIHHDMMRRPGNRGTMFLIGILSAAFVGLLMIPITLCLMLDAFAANYGIFGGWPAGLLGAIVLLLITMTLWRFTLTGAGDLLLAREQRILAALVKDRE